MRVCLLIPYYVEVALTLHFKKISGNTVAALPSDQRCKNVFAYKNKASQKDKCNATEEGENLKVELPGMYILQTLCMCSGSFRHWCWVETALQDISTSNKYLSFESKINHLM